MKCKVRGFYNTHRSTNDFKSFDPQEVELSLFESWRSRSQQQKDKGTLEILMYDITVQTVQAKLTSCLYFELTLNGQMLFCNGISVAM